MKKKAEWERVGGPCREQLVSWKQTLHYITLPVGQSHSHKQCFLPPPWPSYQNHQGFHCSLCQCSSRCSRESCLSVHTETGNPVPEIPGLYVSIWRQTQHLVSHPQLTNVLITCNQLRTLTPDLEGVEDQHRDHHLW